MIKDKQRVCNLHVLSLAHIMLQNGVNDFPFLILIRFSNRVSVVSPVREVVLDLRVFRDLVDFLEHQELMDPRSVDVPQNRFKTIHPSVYFIQSTYFIVFSIYSCDYRRTFFIMKCAKAFLCYVNNIYFYYVLAYQDLARLFGQMQ